MLLPDLILPSRINQHWEYSGIDHIDHARDRQHFLDYPYPVEYVYNSRGFRDQEWPDDLEDCIWCFGDSFTAGVGSPFSHIWPQVLQRKTNRRTINISMDGASNDWISRKIKYLLEEIRPRNIVILWSYFERRERPDPSMTDEQRRMQVPALTDQDYQDNLTHFQQLTAWMQTDTRSNFINAMIPEHYIFDADIAQRAWDDLRGIDWPRSVPRSQEEFQKLPQWILQEINDLHRDNKIKEMIRYCSVSDQIPNFLGTVPKIDLARDGHHFDVGTSDWFTDRIIPLLK